ncbi:MAG: class A beta-lactamase [Roseiarcus sp.]
MISRRGLVLGGLVAAPALASLGARAQDADGAIEAGLAELEARHGGRLGVCMLAPGAARRVGRRADERFAMCSTFKVLAAALALTRVERGQDSLDRKILYDRGAVVAYSPETENHAGEGMTLGEICKAALTLSDNTAGNLMLDSFGGPPALTRYARGLGDEVTELDRFETGLNEATPGDPRDTTTPAAMAANLDRLLLGDALSAPSRQQLTAWMLANRTGDRRLRAGLPGDWRVADKTGGGGNAATNDIAVLWPPGRAPIVVAVYFAQSSAPDEARNGVVAEVGRLAARL